MIHNIIYLKMQDKHQKGILLIKRHFSANFNLVTNSNEIVEKYKSIMYYAQISAICKRVCFYFTIHHRS